MLRRCRDVSIVVETVTWPAPVFMHTKGVDHEAFKVHLLRNMRYTDGHMGEYLLMLWIT